MTRYRWSQLLMGVCLALCSFPAHAPAADQDFELQWTLPGKKEAYSGRVYLFFRAAGEPEPRLDFDWFHPHTVIAVEVKNWNSQRPLRIGKYAGSKLLSFPRAYSELQLTGMQMQAVARFNPWERRLGTGPGNLYSDPARVPPASESRGSTLTLRHVVPEERFSETEQCKLFRVPSRLLTRFYHHERATQGAVLLPTSYYQQPHKRYPVVLKIPGFGGTLENSVEHPLADPPGAGEVEFITVVLDASCPLGHHVFADSANNGPVGTALVEEFLPALDAHFRTVAAPTARFLTGHSSGGWSSLWLQVTYPETFGGVWSTSPDPVDFQDFQQIDLYAPRANMYRAPDGTRRPLARTGNMVSLWYDDFDRMETVLGYGGQLHSFEAAFSPRGPEGRALLCWNRSSGAVNGEVARAWQKYDIRWILESRWKELGPRLRGKLHVFMGTADTFYLEGATRRLQSALVRLQSDAVVELHPGRSHFDLLTGALRQRIRQEMSAAYVRAHPAVSPRTATPAAPK